MNKQCSSCGGFCGKYCQRENIKQERDEPVAWISTGPARMIHWTSDEPAYGDDWVALYTKPQTKEWVKLTEYEIKGVLGLNESWVSEDCSIPDMIGFAKAIEVKLRERNT